MAGVPPPPGPPSFPPPAFLGPPALPPGWTEHEAPSGQPYYYNAATKQSTYTRPLPVFPPLGVLGIPPVPAAAATPAPAAPGKKEKKKKKEKPLKKTPIPDTPWIRVLTSEDNTFYTNTETKQSVWTVPPEIADAIAALDEAEHEAERKRKRAEEEDVADLAAVEGMQVKGAEEEDGTGEPEAKKSRVEDEDEEERAWAEAAAKEMAEEEERERLERTAEEEEERRKEEEEKERIRLLEEKAAQAAQHPTVELSLEEAKALFKTMLTEKSISPLLPWDAALPLFIADPRYAALRTTKDRQDAFDEYCRTAGRVRPSAASIVDPAAAFRELLRAEVRSTRTRWDEFRRAWRKDRRFFGWGRDDREREKAFKQWLRELGEIKRADAKKAGEDFTALLKDTPSIQPDSEWADIKPLISSTPAYIAVGSSSTREALFKSYRSSLSDLSSASTAPSSAKAEDAEAEAARKKAQRAEKAQASLRAREEQVRRDRERVEREMSRSRRGLGREEGEREFMTLLIDGVRDHRADWDSVQPIISADPRFAHPALSSADKHRLFQSHMSTLRSKRLNAAHAVFAAAAPSLATPFAELWSKIEDNQAIKALDARKGEVERLYKDWIAQRTRTAKDEFEQLMAESSFVDYWGRLKKQTFDKDTAKIVAGDEDDEEEGEGEHGGGTADVTALAKQIDLKEMHAVLRHDKRYRILDHIPEQREQWMRDYVDSLTAHKLSVHV